MFDEDVYDHFLVLSETNFENDHTEMSYISTYIIRTTVQWGLKLVTYFLYRFLDNNEAFFMCCIYLSQRRTAYWEQVDLYKYLIHVKRQLYNPFK